MHNADFLQKAGEER